MLKELKLSEGTRAVLGRLLLQDASIMTLLSVATFEHGWPQGTRFNLRLEQVVLEPIAPPEAPPDG